MSGQDAPWRLQLEHPLMRQYDPIPKHSGGPTTGRHGTVMDLPPPAALEILRGAIYDPTATDGEKAPSLWGWSEGRIYRFMWDNAGAWHGYPVEEKPPNAVLQRWKQSGTISNAVYGKILRYPNRGF